MITQTGVVVAGTPTDLLGKKLVGFSPQNKAVYEAITKGQYYSNYNAGVQSDTLELYIPVPMKFSREVWTYAVYIPISEIKAKANQILIMVLGIGISGIFILVLVVMWLAHRLSYPLKMLVKQAQRIAGGDLTGEAQQHQNDEIGQLAAAFESMTSKLRNLISAIRENASILSEGADNISLGSQEIAQGTSQQASTAEEVGSAIEEIQSSISQNAEKARQTSEISSKSAQSIQRGTEAALQTELSLRAIVAQIKLVEDIAAKTDMLAINASIEAARAGQMGKGFAVVAQEVRKLAVNSQRTVAAIRDSVFDSAQKAHDVAEILKEALPVVQQTDELNREISISSNEQQLNSQQISNSVQDLSMVIQSNSATSEELATSAESLAYQGQVLLQQIQLFKL